MEIPSLGTSMDSGISVKCGPSEELFKLAASPDDAASKWLTSSGRIESAEGSSSTEEASLAASAEGVRAEGSLSADEATLADGVTDEVTPMEGLSVEGTSSCKGGSRTPLMISLSSSVTSKEEHPEANAHTPSWREDTPFSAVVGGADEGEESFFRQAAKQALRASGTKSVKRTN